MEPPRDATATRLCIYCEEQKRPDEFSLEHIFPDRLGGDLCNELFKTSDVCRDCNSTAGLFVDGPFIRNFFRATPEALSATQYLDLTSPTSIHPFMYLGIIAEIDLDPDLVCEMWTGPCGNHLYHVHERDEERWESYAGGNPIARKKKPGRVYLLLTTEQPQWVGLVLRSMKKFFPKARRFAGNFNLSAEDNLPKYVEELDEMAAAELRVIKALPEQIGFRIPLVAGFEQRFLAKIARGLGYTILGPDFLITQHAQKLRRMLREKDADERAKLGVRGKGYFDGSADPSGGSMAWPGAYTIWLKIIDNDFVLSLYLPDGKAMHIVISDDPRLWADACFDQYREGVVYLVLPTLGEFVGPVPFPKYIAHRTAGIPFPLLSAIDAKRIDPATLPPCR